MGFVISVIRCHYLCHLAIIPIEENDRTLFANVWIKVLGTVRGRQNIIDQMKDKMNPTQSPCE